MKRICGHGPLQDMVIYKPKYQTDGSCLRSQSHDVVVEDFIINKLNHIFNGHHPHIFKEIDAYQEEMLLL